MPASDDELDELWERFTSNGDPDALELLVIRYEPLARYLAKRALAKAPPYQDREDILSYAHHGLLDAIRRFEPGRVKFETYASRRITGAIIDGQRKQDPLSRGLRKRVKALAAAQEATRSATGQEPTIEQLSAATGEGPEDVRRLLLEQKSLAGSLDDIQADSETATSHDAPQEADLQLAEMRDGLADRLARLDSLERSVIFLHYCEDMTIAEAGKRLGVPETRCRQIRTNALESLQHS